MAVADLKTHCAECDGLILIARDAVQHTRRIECPHCGSPGYVWQLIDRANRVEEPPASPLAGTWEGARSSTTPP